jgi:type II secretory pathway pseudopilin PulG
LIEMLIVLAVIAILAGMILAVLPGIAEKRVRSQVRAELQPLIMAIEYYKEKHGFYPPDNFGFNPPHHGKQTGQPPLFYELGGTRFVPGSDDDKTLYYSLITNGHFLTATKVKNNFGGGNINNKGFVNSAEQESEVKNFISTLKPRQYGPSAYNTDVLVLRVPAKGIKDGAFPTDELNPWRYVVAKPDRGPNDAYPTNNPNSFDLWADVEIRGKLVKIGNWKEE